MHVKCCNEVCKSMQPTLFFSPAQFDRSIKSSVKKCRRVTNQRVNNLPCRFTTDIKLTVTASELSCHDGLLCRRACMPSPRRWSATSSSTPHETTEISQKHRGSLKHKQYMFDKHPCFYDSSGDEKCLHLIPTCQCILEKGHLTMSACAQVHTSTKLRVILRYTACSGLINQQYSHIAAFALAAALGSELVLPPAVQRDSFANYYHVDKQKNEVTWTPAPLSTLLDVANVVAIWKLKGMTVHEVNRSDLIPNDCTLQPSRFTWLSWRCQPVFGNLAQFSAHLCHLRWEQTPVLHGFPDMSNPGTAYPQYLHDAIDERFITHLGDVFQKVQSFL